MSESYSTSRHDLTHSVVNPVTSMSSQNQVATKGLMGPPPRPPRRIQVSDMVEPISPPPPSSTHTVSHSLSSLQMFSPPAHRIALEEQPGHVGGAAGVSRTQSLRAQAKHAETSGLGRSSSLRTPGQVRDIPSLSMEHADDPRSKSNGVQMKHHPLYRRTLLRLHRPPRRPLRCHPFS